MKKLFVFLCIIQFGAVIVGMEGQSRVRLGLTTVTLRPEKEIRKIFKKEGLLDVDQANGFSKRFGGLQCNRYGVHFAISNLASKSPMPISRYELQQLIFIQCAQ